VPHVVDVREAQPGDGTFLVEMLAEAVDWRPDVVRRPAPEVLAVPQFARYVDGWPRPGDAGVVAEEDATPVGAAWYRFLPASAPGYGFVDESVPEVTIAVVPGQRGEGVGSALLTRLVELARGHGVPAVSLSVEAANPAMRLYVRQGFSAVSHKAGAVTMICRLHD
jgi:GNAT superfamily N-acetyltransferase